VRRAQVERHPLEHGATFARERLPRRDVGVVIEFGHDDLVARLERASDRARDVKEQRGHVGAERDLTGIGAEELGQRARACASSASVSALVGYAQCVFALWWNR
jgi:hypothetical protein